MKHSTKSFLLFDLLPWTMLAGCILGGIRLLPYSSGEKRATCWLTLPFGIAFLSILAKRPADSIRLLGWACLLGSLASCLTVFGHHADNMWLLIGVPAISCTAFVVGMLRSRRWDRARYEKLSRRESPRTRDRDLNA